MLARGEINVEERVEIGADVIFMPEGTVTFATDDAQLRMRGQTSVREETEFVGAGMLVNGKGGEMRLFHGTSLADAGLENHGWLGFRRYGSADSAALAAVDRFANGDDGTFAVRIGGDALGEDFDHLLVTNGAATLDGLLEVLLFDANGVPFAPQVGDAFPIITALGGVAGTFANAPVSHRDGFAYHWAVDYSPYQVSLRLEAITVPEPAAPLLAATAAATIAMHRRRRTG